MRVAFLGLGSMGRAMAAKLLRADHDVVVWNRSAGPIEALCSAGATVAPSPTGLFDGDAVISMLSDDVAVRAVVMQEGFLPREGARAVHVNMATVSPGLTRELKAIHDTCGVSYVSAPVFGRAEIAAAGRLHILAAGPASAIDKVQPLFDAMGQRTWRLGEDPAQASIVKIAGNFIVSCAIEAISEAVALVRANGVIASDFVEILTGTIFDTPIFRTYGRLVAAQDFVPAGFRLALGLKDVRLMLSAGDASAVPLPFASVLRDVFLEAVAAGDAELDWSAVSRVAARRAGLHSDVLDKKTVVSS